MPRTQPKWIYQPKYNVRCQQIADLAFDNADWGRLRKRYSGDPSSTAGIRTQTKGYGWYTVTWHYADYVCRLSPTGKYVYIDYGKGGQTRRVWRGKFLLADGTRCELARAPREPVKPSLRHIARLYRQHGLNARLVRQTVNQIGAGSGEHDPNGNVMIIVVDDKCGGWYHVDHYMPIDRLRTMLERRRKTARAAEIDRYLDENGDKVWVSINDSLGAGNCSPGTNQFLNRLTELLQPVGTLGAVRADVILSLRDDIYTRRACQVAVLRRNLN